MFFDKPIRGIGVENPFSSFLLSAFLVVKNLSPGYVVELFFETGFLTLGLIRFDLLKGEVKLDTFPVSFPTFSVSLAALLVSILFLNFVEGGSGPPLGDSSTVPAV